MSDEDQLNYPAKSQRALIDRLYYIENRNEILVKQSSYRKIHKERYAVSRQRYYKSNKDAILRQQSQYRKRRGVYISPHLEHLRYIQTQRQWHQNPIYQYVRLQNDEQMPRKKVEADEID